MQIIDGVTDLIEVERIDSFINSIKNLYESLPGKPIICGNERWTVNTIAMNNAAATPT